MYKRQFIEQGTTTVGRGVACSSREVRLEQMVVFTAQNLCFVVMGQREEQAPPLPINGHCFAEEPADKSEFETEQTPQTRQGRSVVFLTSRGEARTKATVSWNCIVRRLSCRSTRLAARRVDALFMRSMYASGCYPPTNQNLKSFTC